MNLEKVIDEEKIINFLPNRHSLEHLSNFFAGFADGTRLKILSCLSMSEMCVGDMSRILNINQTTLSHQLKYLKNLNLIDCNRTGKQISYYLKNKGVIDIMNYSVDSLF